MYEELIKEYENVRAKSFLEDVIENSNEIVHVLTEHLSENQDAHLATIAMAAAKIAGSDNDAKFIQLYSKSRDALFGDDSEYQPLYESKEECDPEALSMIKKMLANNGK